MNIEDKDNILVNANHLRRVLGFMRRVNPQSDPVATGDAVSLITQQFVHDQRYRGLVAPIEQWDIVEPKPARNNLRAGNTAYGVVVVLFMSPFVVVSLDGKYKWDNTSESDYIVLGRATESKILELNTKWGKYPIIG